MRDETYFRLRGWIPMPLYALTLLTFDRDPARVWELVCGIGLALAGVVLRGWARIHIGRSSDTRRLHARRLVSSGPYALVRNPLYVGNMAIACGLALLIGAGAWAGLLGLALALHYGRVARAEEHMLEARFGDEYRAYRERVRRWWPYSRRPEGIGHNALASLRREWRIAALALLAAALGVAFRS
jgi:protein-S-isoprenylcysteine O-methyltransferase Ste14